MSPGSPEFRQLLDVMRAQVMPLLTASFCPRVREHDGGGVPSVYRQSVLPTSSPKVEGCSLMQGYSPRMAGTYPSAVSVMLTVTGAAR
eukprot:3695073-Prymnesium_polylepis.1